ncbi:hypothetical protein ABEB36_003355 [Hypothenemus hampei]|uniref:Kinesin motor domain-containing protein n=1 Tax=Hypothenemus hampei TaxID=57062 RepID=A0ABD1F8W1_HYPHA
METVKVAVRVRPMVAQEIQKGCREIIEVVPENEQIIIKNSDKAFTFNYVLGPTNRQEELYDKCVAPLLDNIFKGFNVTIFAYGQTGSGKTHSMGTAYIENGNDREVGVIPRIVQEIFNRIRDEFSIDFTITVSFMELYREVLYDLLANKPRDQCILEIREDIVKGIHIPNITEMSVESSRDILEVLVKGSLGRATASTNMNLHSSRSHCIFTINFCMQNKADKSQNKTAKLHLVDLAGSERPKKTGAQGTTFKEGVDINKGLFVLGNVISSLGDEKNQNNFIPYRDSNLTRLLKDSLGGNSVTLMIACVSPADYNLDETLSTLRYADRARRIKNKPIVNQDPKTAEINQLKKQIKQLQLQIVGQGGPVVMPCDIENLKSENNQLNLKIKQLRVELSSALLDKTGLHEKVLILQNANEILNKKLMELKQQCNETFEKIVKGVEKNNIEDVKENLQELQCIQHCFDALKGEQIKAEDEIRTHEETFTILMKSSRNLGGNISKEFEAKEESHTDRQLVLNSELQEVSKKLALKEDLVRKLASNAQYLVDREAMMDTERKIEVLEKEKDDLMQQLRNVKSQENSSKIAEQRRKRVQELEECLKDLKKKVLEQAKLLKLKEKDELRIAQLNNEISTIKSAKIKLVKQMREENERFRSWKQVTDRQLARVKQEDRKKETEIVKMKINHEKQKNVLRRKFEEAAALNKRLQNTLAKRQEAQSMKFNGKIEKISSWLKDEMEVHVNFAEVRTTLSDLLEDRATLQQQLDEMKAIPEMNDSTEMKTVAEDIELRSIQIQDLQQKLLDSDEASKSKIRFDVIQGMAEAKHALRSLFDHAAEYRRKELTAIKERNEARETINELQSKIDKMNADMQFMENLFTDQLANEQKANQEKVGILLKQLRGLEGSDVNSPTQLTERYKILTESLEHQESVNQELQRKIEEQTRLTDDLQKRLNSIKEESEKLKPQGKIKNIKKETKIQTENIIVKTELSDMENSLLVEDDLENDPDWVKTPLAKRMLNMKKSKSRLIAEIKLSRPNGARNQMGTKRSSGDGCACKKCNTQRCKCKKLKLFCGDFCKCSMANCMNAEVSSTNSKEYSTDLDNNEEMDKELNKKPRIHLDFASENSD